MASVDQHVEQEILKGADGAEGSPRAAESGQATVARPVSGVADAGSAAGPAGAVPAAAEQAAAEPAAVEPAAAEPAAESAADIPVENPATGEIVATVPDLGADAVAEMAARGRAAQPEWEAFGFDGRARVLSRAQKWLMDNAQRVTETIVSETGKTWEDAQPRRDRLRGQRFRLLGEAGTELPRRRGRQVQPGAGQGQEADPALSPARADRCDRTLELPVDELLRRLHPGADGRQQRDPQAVGGDAADLAADGRGLRECGLPEHVLQIATGRGGTGAALLEHVDMIMFTGSTRTGRRSPRRPPGA